MNLRNASWMFLKFLPTLVLAVQLLPVAAAMSPQKLTCNVTKLPDGTFEYHLSRPPSSPGCNTEWEDHNKTSIAHGLKYDPKVVLNLTNWYLILQDCRIPLHYSENCLGVFLETYCEANCSLLMDDEHSITTVNSTRTCVFWSWCPDQTHTALLCVIVAVLLITAPFLVRWCYKGSKCKRGEYTSANVQIKMEGDHQETEIEIVNEKLTLSTM